MNREDELDLVIVTNLQNMNREEKAVIAGISNILKNPKTVSEDIKNLSVKDFIIIIKSEDIKID